MDAFFEFLRKNRLTASQLEKTIMAWTPAKFGDIVVELESLLPVQKDRARSVFEFVANSQLSAEPLPCSALECRLEHADELARFAALYADRILIYNPFEKHMDQDLGSITERWNDV